MMSRVLDLKKTQLSPPAPLPSPPLLNDLKISTKVSQLYTDNGIQENGHS